MDRPMWTCPDCGRQFVTARVWHSCMPRRGLDDVLAGRPAGVVSAYQRLEAMIRELGPVQVEPRGWLAEAYWLGTEGAGKRVS